MDHHVWGRSSPGRALEWHSRGSRFDPDRLHQDRNPHSESCVSFVLPHHPKYNEDEHRIQRLTQRYPPQQRPFFLPNSPMIKYLLNQNKLKCVEQIIPTAQRSINSASSFGLMVLWKWLIFSNAKELSQNGKRRRYICKGNSISVSRF